MLLLQYEYYYSLAKAKAPGTLTCRTTHRGHISHGIHSNDPRKESQRWLQPQSVGQTWCGSLQLIYLPILMQQTSQAQSKLASGRWSKEQHQRFMYAIMQFGKDWRKVEQYVKTRTSSQVRSHAQKFFNKLQKAPESGKERDPHEGRHSETEFDLEREMNNELTPSTPMELVSLIRKQSKEDGGKINLSSLKKSLQGEQPSLPKEETPPKEKDPLPNSFKSMSNILSAYQQLSGNLSSADQDESFFISITKKYKKLFKQVEDFDRLIDLHHSLPNSTSEQQPKRSRKRSFTLPQGSSNLEEEAMDERIEEIKKKINPQGKEERQQRREREKGRKDSDSSMQLIAPPLHKLTTIQEQPREQDQNMSFRAILSQSHLDEVKP